MDRKENCFQWTVYNMWTQFSFADNLDLGLECKMDDKVKINERLWFKIWSWILGTVDNYDYPTSNERKRKIKERLTVTDETQLATTKCFCNGAVTSWF
jgi:hypothetical protein